MNQYEETAYAAVVGVYTVEQVRGATYEQVAAFCNVDIAPDGSSPADFYYRIIKRVVATRIEREQRDASRETRRQQILAHAKQLLAFINAEAVFCDEGKSPNGMKGYFIYRPEQDD